METLAQMEENLRISRLAPLSAAELEQIQHLTAEPPLDELCVSPYFWSKYRELHHLS